MESIDEGKVNDITSSTFTESLESDSLSSQDKPAKSPLSPKEQVPKVDINSQVISSAPLLFKAIGGSHKNVLGTPMTPFG